MLHVAVYSIREYPNQEEFAKISVSMLKSSRDESAENERRRFIRLESTISISSIEPSQKVSVAFNRNNPNRRSSALLLKARLQ